MSCSTVRARHLCPRRVGAAQADAVDPPGDAHQHHPAEQRGEHDQEREARSHVGRHDEVDAAAQHDHRHDDGEQAADLRSPSRSPTTTCLSQAPYVFDDCFDLLVGEQVPKPGMRPLPWPLRPYSLPSSEPVLMNAIMSASEAKWLFDRTAGEVPTEGALAGRGRAGRSSSRACGSGRSCRHRWRAPG